MKNAAPKNDSQRWSNDDARSRFAQMIGNKSIASIRSKQKWSKRRPSFVMLRCVCVRNGAEKAKRRTRVAERGESGGSAASVGKGEKEQMRKNRRRRVLLLPLQPRTTEAMDGTYLVDDRLG